MFRWNLFRDFAFPLLFFFLFFLRHSLFLSLCPPFNYIAVETIAKQIRRVRRAAGIRLSNEGLSFTHRPAGVLLSNFHRSGWTLDQRALSDAACKLLGDCRFTKPAQRPFSKPSTFQRWPDVSFEPRPTRRGPVDEFKKRII